MTNSTRMIGLIMIAAIWAGVANGQEWPLGGLGDTPPELVLPDADNEATEVMRPVQEGTSRLVGPEATVPFGEYEPEGYQVFGPGMEGFWHGATAEIESTSTWLRRGFWYAEAEAVILNRMWNRDDMRFAVADSDANRTDFESNEIIFQALLNTNRMLIVNGAQPGEDSAVRATLGSFLFRDSRNRDHTLEFTAFGGGDWAQHRVLSSQQPFGLFVPYSIDGANRSFDNNQTGPGALGSSRQTLDYSSQLNSFELNYRVKQRPSRDQMIMDPNGNWHRAANSGFVRDYLAGLRLMEARDILDWRAEDILALGNDGSYLIRTDNDMIGFQLGAGIAYETARWSLGAHAKGGVFINDASGRTTLNFTADDTGDADLRFRADELSFIGEFKLLGRWHVLPNVSLRAAYELMYLTSQALAPNQATFITDFSYLNTTQDPFFHGASFGFEGYW